MSKTILLPVDLNDPEASKTPLHEALALVGENGVLHVVSVLPDFGLPQVSGFFKKDFEATAIKSFGTALKTWVNETVPDDVEVHPHILHGTIYDEILRAADKLKVDLIVMGSHRPELRDYLLGPNAARVVRHAKQSVYVVRN